MATQSMGNKNDRHVGGSETRPYGEARRARIEDEQEEGFLERGHEQLREMMADREGQSVLVALAVGFGIGVAIGYNLGGSSQPERWTDRVAAEGLGRRLLERLDSILPESISSKLAR